MNFEWDEAKAAANLQKHGVSFDEAATVLAEGLSLTGRDPDHSVGEQRFVTFGLSADGRILALSHAERRGTRLISARLATRAERNPYEEG